MTKYNPNFNDPRVKKRINKSLDYALANLSATKPKQWSTRQIDVWFGNQGNKLSKMLREQLLVVDNPYYNPDKGIAKKYLLNMQGAQRLAEHVNRTVGRTPSEQHTQRVESADRLFGSSIEQGVFEYKEKSSRLWHNCQNLDNTTRKHLFANYGYVHEYDIKSSAPTILYQLARRTHLTRPTKTIDSYLENPEQSRTRLQNLLNVDRKTAKQLITSRFAGARFGRENSIAQQLDFNRLAYERIVNDEWYAQLSKDIKKMWDALKIHEGHNRLNTRTKWSIYYREELRIMKLVYSFLDKQGITKRFHEHDGWRSQGAVDLRQLQLHIHKASGYWIEFDYEVFDI